MSMGYFAKYKNDLTEVSRKRIEINPLRILDTKVNFEIELIKNAQITPSANSQILPNGIINSDKNDWE